jgi:aspartate/methionine/tyrosine aminotransferase
MRTLIDELPASKIREVANAAMGRGDVLAFWFGESDEATPQFIRDAAARSIAEGETFYSHNLGLAELREAIAGYVSSLHPAVDSARIAVTSSGVSALMLAMQALVGAGDEVVAVVPSGPTSRRSRRSSARASRASPCARRQDGAWRLDVEALKRAVTDRPAFSSSTRPTTRPAGR